MSTRDTPHLAAIYVCSEPATPMLSLTQVDAVAGRGLRGDRYYEGTGTFSHLEGSGRALTLIESEVLDALEREHGIQLSPAETRRNLLTVGVRLNELVGQEFRVGEVRLKGMRLAEPCAHLEQLTQPGVLKALVGLGGLRAEILNSRRLRVGDIIE